MGEWKWQYWVPSIPGNRPRKEADAAKQQVLTGVQSTSSALSFLPGAKSTIKTGLQFHLHLIPSQMNSHLCSMAGIKVSSDLFCGWDPNQTVTSAVKNQFRTDDDNPQEFASLLSESTQTFTDNSCSKDLWVLGAQNIKNYHFLLILILPSLGSFGQPSFYTRKRSFLYSSSSSSYRLPRQCLSLAWGHLFGRQKNMSTQSEAVFLPLIIFAAHLRAFSLFCFLPFLGLLKLI